MYTDIYKGASRLLNPLERALSSPTMLFSISPVLAMALFSLAAGMVIDGPGGHTESLANVARPVTIDLLGFRGTKDDSPNILLFKTSSTFNLWGTGLIQDQIDVCNNLLESAWKLGTAPNYCMGPDTTEVLIVVF